MTRRSSQSRNKNHHPDTPSTLDKTGYEKSGIVGSVLTRRGAHGADDLAYAPEQFKATASIAGLTTDEQGNRLSILPGSSRPSQKRPATLTDRDKTIASFAPGASRAEASSGSLKKEESDAALKKRVPSRKTLLDRERERAQEQSLKTKD